MWNLGPACPHITPKEQLEWKEHTRTWHWESHNSNKDKASEYKWGTQKDFFTQDPHRVPLASLPLDSIWHFTVWFFIYQPVSPTGLCAPQAQ